MTLSHERVLTDFRAVATPTVDANEPKARIGAGLIEHAYPTANIAGAYRVVSAATGNVATHTLSTSAVAGTTGSPTVHDGDGKDFEGVSLPTMSVLMAMRIRTGAANTGTVTLGGSNSSLLPAMVLGAGREVTVALPAAGVSVGAGTLTHTFSAASDEVTVEFLGKSAS